MTIHFLTMSDFLGRLRPFRPFMAGEQAPSERGGIARVATFIKRLQQERSTRVIPLVAGLDLMGPGLELLGGESEIAALDMAGFVAAVPGIHEFESGPDLAGAVLGSVPFSILAANLEPAHSKLAGTVTAHAVFDSGRTRVGVFGLAMAGPGARLAPDPLFKTRDLIETAQEQVAILRATGCEVIVALTHIGTPSDCQVAARVSGIHAIFGGHSHTPTSRPEIIVSPDGWQTLVTQAGTAGASLGHLSLTLRDGRVDPEKTKWTLVPIDQNVEPDPHVEKYLDQAEAKVQAALSCVVG
ncbi:MAG: hypothetical protein V2J11_10185, partial [Desulfofustis sp.]|nr:hypothetical protein [Desulfofustis sp.]